MNTYILVMVLTLYSDSVETLQVEFDTKKACLVAMEEIEQDLLKTNPVRLRSANCFKKSVD